MLDRVLDRVIDRVHGRVLDRVLDLDPSALAVAAIAIDAAASRARPSALLPA